MRYLTLSFLFVGVMACGDGGNDADAFGVGAECSTTEDCFQDTDAGVSTTCLTQFTGGYCGVQDCSLNEDCPEGSLCVAHDDGSNYCFRACTDKEECNENRSADVEANCSGNITFVEDDTEGKACVPPSSN